MKWTNPMRGKLIAATLALMVSTAAPAAAQFSSTSSALAPGGRTLAGPAKAKIAIQTTEVIYTHPATNTDACVSVSGVTGSAVRLTLVGGNTTTLDVAVGGSAALCKTALVRMDLTCLGATTCTAQWRVDAN